jgi:antitoxin ParD1/3/4
MDTITIDLPARQRAFVEAKVTAGTFSSPSDYLATLVREAEKREAAEALAALLREGEESGPPIEMTRAEWDAIWQDARTEFARKRGT